MNKSKFRFNALVLSLLAALLFISAVGAAPKDGPSVSLSLAQGEFNASQDVLVTVTISNPHKHTVRVLKWFTPADGLMEEPLFTVTRDGQPVAYTGAHYKRPGVTGKDYISLKAGESRTSVINLGDYYDLTASGTYDITYAVASFNLFDEKGNAFAFTDVLASEKVSAKVEARAAKGKPTPPPPPPPGGNSFIACSADQQSQLVSARSQAKVYASDAEKYLNRSNPGPRYTTWFGVFSTARYNTVRSNFTAISDAMDNAGVTFDCKCKQKYYAYVYSNEPYKIYLCQAFWSAPLSGTDSKAGTLIHEMSHFDVVAGTNDWAYGQTAAMNLASTDPDRAVTNADSHEYFAENTPPLP